MAGRDARRQFRLVDFQLRRVQRINRDAQRVGQELALVVAILTPTPQSAAVILQSLTLFGGQMPVGNSLVDERDAGLVPGRGQRRQVDTQRVGQGLVGIDQVAGAAAAGQRRGLIRLGGRRGRRGLVRLCEGDHAPAEQTEGQRASQHGTYNLITNHRHFLLWT